MTPKTTTATTLFAAICGCAKLQETLGEAAVRRLMGSCIELLSSCAADYEGNVVKAIDDEVLCVFPTPENAVRAAMDMQRRVAAGLRRRATDTPHPLPIRIGMHHGPASVGNGEMTGDAVEVADEMVALARAGQIIVSRETARELPPELRCLTRDADPTVDQNDDEGGAACEVVWQSELAGASTGAVMPRSSVAHLVLRCGSTQVSLKPGDGPFVIGRGRNARLLIPDPMASREHARIECRDGRYFLSDQSTNGTYVQTAGGVSYLRYEEMELAAKGKLALGRTLDEARHVVLFALLPQL